MMTGNVVFFGRAVLANERQEPPADGWFYMVLIVTFFLGAVAHRVAETKMPKRGASTLGFAFAALMVGVEVASIVLPDEAYGGHYLLAGLTPMFGLVMSACSSGSVGVPTTLVTGHITTLASLGTKAVMEGGLTGAEIRRAKLGVLVMACTLLGAGAGAALTYLAVGPAQGLLLPVAPTLALLLWIHDHMARPRSLIKSFHRRLRERRARASGKGHAATFMSDTSTVHTEASTAGASTTTSDGADGEWCCCGGACSLDDVPSRDAAPGLDASSSEPQCGGPSELDDAASRDVEAGSA
eukprot:CAMPEP_0176296302 /NCGR_PEP_ID=MMETSP0121_2-20121125/58124_1 /TAXON_ID=160619 /ORGANISM="Kryptoperidinium foliaceum, Strain CCMP 1326" /LENGTH=296 /DNA_ID=CAMNT_0017637431 /DNA_START=87 /DNA_END=975 /DNA_ORIENTATION=+